MRRTVAVTLQMTLEKIIIKKEDDVVGLYLIHHLQARRERKDTPLIGGHSSMTTAESIERGNAEMMSLHIGAQRRVAAKVKRASAPHPHHVK